MKPFLLLQSRPEDATSDNEYQSFLAATGLTARELVRVRVESAPMPRFNLEEYSGIIVGGGPFSVSDTEEIKSDTQKRVEADFRQLLEDVVEKDFPFFGACYGVGTLGAFCGGKISNKYAEPVAPTTISLTNEGRLDPIFVDAPSEFEAIVGHKEACEVLPPGAVHLASSKDCPVQMFRIKNNLYVSQFHPELTLEDLAVRVNVYKNAGYFPPEDAQKVIDGAAFADLSCAPIVLRNFVARYANLPKYS